MERVLVRIKRAVRAGRYELSSKALDELGEAGGRGRCRDLLLFGVGQTNRKLTMVHQQVCPCCGSGEIRKVRRTLTRKFRGRSYKVPRVEYYSCPRCGEEVFSPEADRKIQAASAAFQSSSAP